MSNAIIYFGAPTKAGQIVSEEVRSRGVNLLRSSPADAYPEVIRAVTTIQYLNYQNNFAAAVRAAVRDEYVTVGQKTIFYQPSRTSTTPFMQTPTIVWNYTRPLSSETLSGIRDRFNAAETVAQGKPAFMAKLSPQQVASLVTDTQPNDKTPASTTTINIDAYRTYIRLHRLADLFLRVHQYPLTEDAKKVEHYYEDSLQVREAEIAKDIQEYGTEGKKYKVWGGKTMHQARLNMNLKQKDLDLYKYTIVEASECSGEASLLFPFMSSLAKNDNRMVIDTIERYLFCLLGPDAETAIEVFRGIKAGWGVLSSTSWGDELAHVYAAIRLSLDSGAMPRIILTPNNVYQGFVMVGGGYMLIQWGVEYHPVSNALFVSAFNKSSPHLSSFLQLLDMINFPDDMTREGYRVSITSNAKLSLAFRTFGYDANKEELIKQLARHLVFPSDMPLPMTSVNVASVLNAMSTGISEETFPLHCIAILERDKRKRLLSAFGAVAPTFIIPGGRGVSLDGAFEYNVMVKGKKEAKTTTRMFAMAVPWAKACMDLDKVLIDKRVYTPIGTPLAGRASSASLIREYSGPGGVSVLGALRSLCGVAMVSVASGSSKRGREDDTTGDDAPARKKAAFDLF